ncbi:MAG: aminotransferase class V-fold PLP-dependent enzyme [Vicinamibacterales bacterium]
MHRFGVAMRAEWPLDPTITYLNHGTVGVTPLRVLAAQQQIRDEIERQPSRFLLRELTAISVGLPGSEPPRIRQAAAAIAAYVGADRDDVVFIDNATTGANAVLRSFPLGAGDEILVTDLGYGGVTQAAMFAARQHGATVRTAVMPHPIRSTSQLVEACVAALGPRTRLAIVDHITSQSALIMPLAEITAQCRSRGVAVLADGAHAPGAIPLDIPSLGVDWYVANLHKWMWVPRSSAILWSSPARKADLHPAVISWGLDQGFTAEFDLPGTRDPSPHLAAPAAIRMMEEFGGAAVREYNHALAWDGARLLAERWGSEFVTPESMIGTMATVALPAAIGSTADEAVTLRSQLLFEDRIEVQLHAYGGRLHARISAQIYNDLDDVERLAAAVVRRRPAAAPE